MNNAWVLNRRPIGYPKESDFKWIESPLPEIDEGEILIEAHYLSLDPQAEVAPKQLLQDGHPNQVAAI